MSDIKEIDARKKELLGIEKETRKERQKLLAMVMEREAHLEKRERAVLDREKSVREKEIKLDEGNVSFKLVMEFGDRTFEMDFTGKLAESKLTGELSNDQFNQKITGANVVRTRRGPRNAG